MSLTDEQLRILRHMLGIDTPHKRVPEPYRNYYCANPDDPALVELEAIGAVRCYRRDQYHWFTTTDAGRAAAMASHRKIRHSKGARVYGSFLNVRDCFPDLTFRQFLTNPAFAETRRNA